MKKALKIALSILLSLAVAVLLTRMMQSAFYDEEDWTPPVVRTEPGRTPAADEKLAAARSLFQTYQRLEGDFDARIFDLYAEDAVIRNRRHYPGGTVREMEVPISQFRTLGRFTLPIARLIGDGNSYSQIHYIEEGDGVRITASRFAERKEYHSPFSLLVTPAPSGDWKIVEETGESRP